MQRVLVIEDNPADMELMAYLLEAYGCEALPAADVRQGLAAVRRERPALVVCDVELPHRSGLDLIRALKADPELSAIPVLAVSALAAEGDRERLLAAGFDGCLGKPVDPDKFVESLEGSLLRGKPSAHVQQQERRRDGDHTDR